MCVVAISVRYGMGWDGRTGLRCIIMYFHFLELSLMLMLYAHIHVPCLIDGAREKVWNYVANIKAIIQTSFHYNTQGIMQQR